MSRIEPYTPLRSILRNLIALYPSVGWETRDIRTTTSLYYSHFPKDQGIASEKGQYRSDSRMCILIEVIQHGIL
jgi:hypothetical protein